MALMFSLIYEPGSLMRCLRTSPSSGLQDGVIQTLTKTASVKVKLPLILAFLSIRGAEHY